MTPQSHGKELHSGGPQAWAPGSGGVGPAIPNNYIVQELKSCLLPLGAGCGLWMGGLWQGFSWPGAGSPWVQAVLGRWGLGRSRTLSGPLFPGAAFIFHTTSTKARGFSGCDQLAAADSSWGCAISKYWLRLLTPALLHPWIFSLAAERASGSPRLDGKYS